MRNNDWHDASQHNGKITDKLSILHDT